MSQRAPFLLPLEGEAGWGCATAMGGNPLPHPLPAGEGSIR